MTRSLRRADRDVRRLPLQPHEPDRLTDIAADLDLEVAREDLHRFLSIRAGRVSIATIAAARHHHRGERAVAMPAGRTLARQKHPAGRHRDRGYEQNDAHGDHHERIIEQQTQHSAWQSMKYSNDTFCSP